MAPTTLSPKLRREASPTIAETASKGPSERTVAIADRSSNGVAAWAVGGVIAMFVEAAYRLAVKAAETVQAGLSPFEWVAFAAIAGSLAYFEGYRAFQVRFGPRIVARAFAFSGEFRPRWIPLAPFHALSLFGGTRAEIARGWLVVALVAGAVFAVRALPFPWRGLVDGGVSIALAWGIVAMTAEFVRRVRRTG